MPTLPTPRHLRVVAPRPTDVERVRAWIVALPAGDVDDLTGRMGLWSLRDLSRATGVPMCHLPTVLWQCGWTRYQPEQKHSGVVLWQSPEHAHWDAYVRGERRWRASQGLGFDIGRCIEQARRQVAELPAQVLEERLARLRALGAVL